MITSRSVTPQEFKTLHLSQAFLAALQALLVLLFVFVMTSATSWVFMNYFANDSETRYVAIGNPNPVYYANQAAFPSASTYHGVAHSHADGAMYYAHGGNWIKMAKDSDVTIKLPLAGGTLTGDLTLSGAPTSNLHAATKAYVDTEVAGLVDVCTWNSDILTSSQPLSVMTKTSLQLLPTALLGRRCHWLVVRLLAM